MSYWMESAKWKYIIRPPIRLKYQEPFSLSSAFQSFIACDKREGSGVLPGCHEGGGQQQRILCTQGVDPKEPERPFSHFLGRKDLETRLAE